MAINPSMVGEVFAALPYEVSREKIREFAAALRDDNPAYHDPDAARALGHPDVIAPPSFLMIISLEAERKLVYDPSFGIGDPRRLVHREQRFAHRRPAHAGDRLTVAIQVTDVEYLGDNEVLHFEDRITDADGELVSVATSTFVSFPEERA
ncbi:FAS1-like dehydratase domain-containing protein [Kutzneria sp. CA-103260]|uniref:FAS1-like dehydratase domain-containing protein n=1 Tax=Kutzneria sp. CA-103260 TaxID=2802641 RepID=UPI001BA5427C|nr:MaoC family dehydratase N-terminal domain-containing protein [Kutzneria sp. CA-103260]QUQ63099.1 MaoC family dehydratase [Kutzneria sp. CA-103260]